MNYCNVWVEMKNVTKIFILVWRWADQVLWFKNSLKGPWVSLISRKKSKREVPRVDYAVKLVIWIRPEYRRWRISFVRMKPFLSTILKKAIFLGCTCLLLVLMMYEILLSLSMKYWELQEMLTLFRGSFWSKICTAAFTHTPIAAINVNDRPWFYILLHPSIFSWVRYLQHGISYQMKFK